MKAMYIISTVFSRQRGDTAEAEPDQYQIHLDQLSISMVSMISMANMPVDWVSQQRLHSGHKRPRCIPQSFIMDTAERTVYTTAASSVCVFISYVVVVVKKTPVNAAEITQLLIFIPITACDKTLPFEEVSKQGQCADRCKTISHFLSTKRGSKQDSKAHSL